MPVNEGPREETLRGNPDCSVWVFRHFTTEYDPDEHLVPEKANSQTSLAIAAILSEVGIGDTVVLYGAGAAVRHQQSINILHQRLAEKQESKGMYFRLVFPIKPDELCLVKKSLNPGPFVELKKFYELAPGQAHETWLEEGEKLMGIVETPIEAANRIDRLVTNLLTLGLKDESGSRVHFVVVTSAEIMEQGYGPHLHTNDTNNGSWVRFDAARDLNTVHATTVSGNSWEFTPRRSIILPK